MIEIIAEIAQAHEGSLGLAHSYIDALATTGVSTVKFQMHLADAESSDMEQFRVNFSYEDKTRYDYWKRMGFTLEQWAGLKAHCEEKGLQFLCSPFSVLAVEWMEELKVDRYKIASGEISNYLMIDKICRTGKPILISSGMSSFQELDACVNFISNNKGNLQAVFQCTTAYPTPAEKYGLNVIHEMRERYQTKIGLSDHSGEIYAGLAAVTLGAELLEMHVAFNKKMFGPDTASSLTIDDFKLLCDGASKIKSSLDHPIDKNEIDQYSELKKMFGKSLAVNKDLKQGTQIRLEDLESKKPGGLGLDAKDYQTIIGKKLTRDVSENSFLNNEDFEQ